MTFQYESPLEAAIICAMRHKYRYRGYESHEKNLCRPSATLQRHSPPGVGRTLTLSMNFYARAEELVRANNGKSPNDKLTRFLLSEFTTARERVAKEALGWGLLLVHPAVTSCPLKLVL